ncbi:hypothetical protein PCANC_21941 [Puccinia coronata f. sp. avenae]|uniref:Uncharacterized protein n=1 Tax=Puccinia coronata f. sp. avenae TaxID=200324 RepID=A0A2N5SFU2_9BASI|nr:hypothetical protein PCANC_21941 [Puccinia coronata f. sp. avenae]
MSTTSAASGPSNLTRSAIRGIPSTQTIPFANYVPQAYHFWPGRLSRFYIYPSVYPNHKPNYNSLPHPNPGSLLYPSSTAGSTCETFPPHLPSYLIRTIPNLTMASSNRRTNKMVVEVFILLQGERLKARLGQGKYSELQRIEQVRRRRRGMCPSIKWRFTQQRHAPP